MTTAIEHAARRRITVMRQAYDALRQLAEHPAFANGVEFDVGGVGYDAVQALERILYGSDAT